MPAKAKVVVTGIGRIDRVLRTLPLRIQKKVVSSSMRAGMKLMQKSVKAEVPVDTGLTKSSVLVRAGLKRKRSEVSIDVRIDATAPGTPKGTYALADVHGLKKTSKRTGKTVFYPAIVEYGHANIPPNPFMRRAFLRDGDRARKVTIAALRSGVEREARSS